MASQDALLKPSDRTNYRPKMDLSDGPAASLRHLLITHADSRQLVLLQDFPDPDALSAAWAYQLIAAAYDVDCDIFYSGTLSHQENIALVKLTNLPAKRWSNQKPPDLSQYAGYVLIDTQGTTSQLLERVNTAGLPLLVVIDHHRLQGKSNAEFSDIRPDTRATATILTQYLQAGLLDLDRSNS